MRKDTKGMGLVDDTLDKSTRERQLYASAQKIVGMKWQ